MKGITWLDRQAVMLIVAEPAGSGNGSDSDRPWPTTVTVVPSIVTPGDSAGVGTGATLAGAVVGVGVTLAGAPWHAAKAGSSSATSARRDRMGTRRSVIAASPCGGRWRR